MTLLPIRVITESKETSVSEQSEISDSYGYGHETQQG